MNTSTSVHKQKQELLLLALFAATLATSLYFFWGTPIGTAGGLFEDHPVEHQ